MFIFPTLLVQAPVAAPAAREMKKEEDPKPKRIELAEPKERERERVVIGAGGNHNLSPSYYHLSLFATSCNYYLFYLFSSLRALVFLSPALSFRQSH